MVSINANRPQTTSPATGPTGPQSTTPVASPTPATGTQTTTPATPTTPIPSGAGAFTVATKLDGGYASTSSYDHDSYAVAGQNAGNGFYNSATNTGGAKAANGAGYQRGAIEVKSAPIDDKHFALEVKSMHANPSGRTLAGSDDSLALYLETKVQGKDAQGNPKELILRLAKPLNGPANNVGPHDGLHRIVVSYEELNQALKAHNPALALFDAKGAFMGAGATIAVRAKWASGHDWGGYGRMGVTEIPAPVKAGTIASVQAGNIATSSAVKIAASEMPVDFEHVMPESIQKKHAALFNQAKPVTVSTRLERELKGKVDDVVQHEAAIVRMQLISAGYQPLVDELRGNLAAQLMAKAKMKPAEARAYAAKIHISPHTEWAQKGANGRYQDSARLAAYKNDPNKLVDAGLAKTPAEAKAIIEFVAKNGIIFHDPLPLEDKYKGKKSEMQQSVIRRVRSNAIAEGVYNVKPGPGVLQGDVDVSTRGEPCGLIRARIEASVELKDKNVDRTALEKYELEDGSPYNVIGQLLEQGRVYTPGNSTRYQLAANTDMTDVSFTMNQERHRFDIEVDGLKLDTSIDFVQVEDPPGSGTVATRQIVEMEIDHKFIAPPTAGGAPSTSPKPTSPSASASGAGATSTQLVTRFSDLKDQQTQAAALTDVSLNVPPRFHRLEDLADKELWQTKEQVISNAVTNALVGVIYPHGVAPCEQKGVELARALGKI
jgi:hypothetical protein